MRFEDISGPVRKQILERSQLVSGEEIIGGGETKDGRLLIVSSRGFHLIGSDYDVVPYDVIRGVSRSLASEANAGYCPGDPDNDGILRLELEGGADRLVPVEERGPLQAVHRFLLARLG